MIEAKQRLPLVLQTIQGPDDAIVEAGGKVSVIMNYQFHFSQCRIFFSLLGWLYVLWWSWSSYFTMPETRNDSQEGRSQKRISSWRCWWHVIDLNTIMKKKKSKNRKKNRKTKK